MPISTDPVMDALKTLLLTVQGVKAVSFGWPANPTAQLAAWITLSGRGSGQDNRAYGLIKRETRLVGWLAMAVGTAPSAVEYALAAAVDDLEVKAYQARVDWPAAGICQAVRFDFALADNPDYLMFSGTERRVWPFGVDATQSLATPI